MPVELVPDVPVTPIDEGWKALLLKKGKEIATVPFNAYLYLKHHPHFKGFIRWNKVTLSVEISGGILAECPDKDNFDTVVTKAVDVFAAVFDLDFSREDIGRRIAYVAEENAFDPLQDYLNGLIWDGIPRIDTWLVDYAEARHGDDGYVSFVGQKWLLACVARAFQPGCKADVVLIAEGRQGVHKSTMFSILGGTWYSEASGVLGDKDTKQLIGAAWICELPDMSSFSRTNRNAMKAFFTSAVDRYRAPYDKATKAVKRRCCFAATTNDERYLGDPTGNRRFWPVMLGEIDRARLIKDRDQLWAEAVVIYKAALLCDACKALDEVVPGEIARCPEHSWWLTAAQKVIAEEHVEIREESDSWAPAILAYAKAPFGHGGPGGSSMKPAVTTANILIYAIDKFLRDITRADEMRVAAIMKRHGYTRERRGQDVPWEKKDKAPHQPTSPHVQQAVETMSPEDVAASIAFETF